MAPSMPRATYRFQFHGEFRFRDARELVDYLADLGISHLYASPFLQARPGSRHGYDVTDHGELNPEIGGMDDLGALAEALRARGMSLLLDVVPNHMGVAGSSNPWWLDVLENGPASPFADHFDIDWEPPKPGLAEKVLLPILGDQFGRVLESGQIQVRYREGAFIAHYYETVLPLAPRSWTEILQAACRRTAARLGESHPEVQELESIGSALAHLPPRSAVDAESVHVRTREKEIIKRRLAALTASSPALVADLEDVLTGINGRPGEPASFDALEALLDDQAYRLSDWRVAMDEINYRRFFDINDLAAVRVEVPEVFEAVHRLVFDLVERGWVSGLRVDHPDGLYDPAGYFRRLQARCAPPARGERPRFYVVAEKILGLGEELPEDWPVHGTTGYEFLASLSGLFVDPSGRAPLERFYARLVGRQVDFATLVYECKKLILQVSLSSELTVLARRLDRLSEQHRSSRDFTFNSQLAALTEVIACFPVYRSYLRPGDESPSPTDRERILAALRRARRRNPALSGSLFDFLADVLLLRHPAGLSESERAERREFVLRFQQLTGPVTAKGIEDTAFYRHYPLASLNEVGGHPELFGATPAGFHRAMRRRARRRPYALSATATHDTKRGEDLRVRLHGLSEIPREWGRAVTRWRRLNRVHRQVLEDGEAPDANLEYLFYQTALGAWPLDALDRHPGAEFVTRLQEYLVKAAREAKVHTSWLDPDEAHDEAVRRFVARALEPGDQSGFVADLLGFVRAPALAGARSSLVQSVFKVAAPGVPDFYQGNELWDFHLVDPDNRRAVDYARRRELLRQCREDGAADPAAFAADALLAPEDGRIKMWITERALACRRDFAGAFERGRHLPLRPVGPRRNHLLGFARVWRDEAVLAVGARFFLKLAASEGDWSGPRELADTAFVLPRELPAGVYRDFLTGRELELGTVAPGRTLAAGEALFTLPVGLWARLP